MPLNPSNQTWSIINSDNRNWSFVAMSATGQYQTAVVNGGTICISSDYGTSWTDKDQSRAWYGIAMSASGKYQTAVVNGGRIYLSNNYGISWSSSTTPDSDRNWYKIAMSASGKYQTAVIYNGSIWISSDFGTNYDNVAGTSSTNWNSIAMSASGQYQTAVVNGGRIYLSNNYGISWFLSNAPSDSKNWNKIAMSASGKYQTAVVYGGYIWISSDYGGNFSEVTGAGSKNWNNISMSASGKYQTAVVNNEKTYFSSDYGNTWNTYDTSTKDWQSIAMSSSGQYQTAVVYGGSIYSTVLPIHSLAVNNLVWNPQTNILCYAKSNNDNFTIDLMNQSTYTGCNWGVYTDKSGISNMILICTGDTGRVGIRQNNPTVALDVDGSIKYTGTLNGVSDYRIKSDITPMNINITSTVLNPVSYQKRDNLKTEYGFIAHEVQKYYPELVSGNKDEVDASGNDILQSLNYIGIIPIAVNDIIRLDKEVKELKNKNIELENKINLLLNKSNI
jgi:hypothetical protein